MIDESDVVYPLRWSRLEKLCKDNEALSDEEKENVIDSLNYIRKEFAEDFMHKGHKERHPLVGRILNCSTESMRWLVWFTNTLKEMSKYQGFNTLLKDLKERTKFNSALWELVVTDKFEKVDFKIKLYPLGKSKSGPDLSIYNTITKEEILVEATQLILTPTQEIAQEIHYELNFHLFTLAEDIFFAGELLAPYLSKKTIETIIKKTTELSKEANRKNQFKKYNNEFKIELGIASFEKRRDIHLWCIERNYRLNVLRFPKYETNEIGRIFNKVNDKIKKQIPEGQDCIITLYTDNLFWFMEDYKKTMKQLEEIVWTFPNLIALIVAGYGTSLEEVGTIDYDGNQYIIDDNYPFDGSYIIIWNKFSTNQINSKSKSKIIKAFEKQNSK